MMKITGIENSQFRVWVDDSDDVQIRRVATGDEFDTRLGRDDLSELISLLVMFQQYGEIPE